MKVGAVIQTRMGSTRLYGKVMLDLFGKTVIEHVIERLKQCNFLDEIIIATTMKSEDDIIYKIAKKNNVKAFRGSEDDVLSRYYHAARENNLDAVVRITSDCPLIDPFVTDEIIKFYLNNEYLLVTNAGDELNQRTYPRGLDTEVFSFKELEEAFNNSTKEYQREHVTPYIYEKNNEKIFYYKNNVDYSKYRWTLDTEEDYLMIKTIYHKLYCGKHDFYYKDILDLMAAYPYISEINADIEQKKLDTTK